MRRPRCILPSEVYFVTVRTVDEQFALSPHACPGVWRMVSPGIHLDQETRLSMAHSGQACVRQTEELAQQIAYAEQHKKPLPRVNYTTFTDCIPNIIGSWLARGIQHFQIKLYGFVAMSNHVHMLIQAPHGNFAEFMAYFNGQVAREVNRFLGRRHQLWARRYAAAQVLDEPAELERLLYILTNPQKAGIANTIEQWSGLSSATFLLKNQRQHFLCFDRTRWYNAGQPDDIGPYLSTVELEHDVLPQLRKHSTKERQARLNQMLRERERAMARANVRHDRDDSIQRAQHPAKVTFMVPTDRPASPKRSPQPLCHTTSLALFKVFARWFRLFVHACRRSSQAYIRGDVGVEFPHGAFAPSKFPRARYPKEPDTSGIPHLTRMNLHRASIALTS